MGVHVSNASSRSAWDGRHTCYVDVLQYVLGIGSTNNAPSLILHHASTTNAKLSKCETE